MALLLARVEHRPETVEPRIARDGERGRQVHVGEDAGLDVVEDDVPNRQGAGTGE